VFDVSWGQRVIGTKMLTTMNIYVFIVKNTRREYRLDWISKTIALINTHEARGKLCMLLLIETANLFSSQALHATTYTSRKL
jgi:hypothetical protein